MSDEINENDLMNEDEMQLDQNEVGQNYEIQLGFVQLMEPNMENVFSGLFANPPSSLSKKNVEFIRIWAKHLAPGLSKSSVVIPENWANIFTTMLVNPSSFTRAKQFLSSPTWSNFADHMAPRIAFSLPEKCPPVQLPSCLSGLPNADDLCNLYKSLEIDASSTDGKGKGIAEDTSPVTPFEDLKQRISSSPGPWSKSFLATADQDKHSSILENPKARRSLRMQNLKKGFKDAPCSSRSCLGCNVTAP